MKLFVKGISKKPKEREKKISEIKKYFLAEINKVRRYNQYQIIYHSYDNPLTDQDKCFNKFVRGKEEPNKIKPIDDERLLRLHWVHVILDYMIYNGFKSVDNTFLVVTNNPDPYAIKLNLYIIYLPAKYLLCININNKMLVVASAYNIKDSKLREYMSYFKKEL